MDIEKMTSFACRIFFGLAMLALMLSVLEKIANLMGYTFLEFVPLQDEANHGHPPPPSISLCRKTRYRKT